MRMQSRCSSDIDILFCKKSFYAVSVQDVILLGIYIRNISIIVLIVTAT